MLAKRLGVLGLSAVLGAAVTYLMLLVIRVTMQSNVTPAYYGYDYFILTSLFIGAAILVWLDHILGARILPK